MCLRIFFRRFLITLPIRFLAFFAAPKQQPKSSLLQGIKQTVGLRSHAVAKAQPKNGLLRQVGQGRIFALSSP